MAGGLASTVHRKEIMVLGTTFYFADLAAWGSWLALPLRYVV